MPPRVLDRVEVRPAAVGHIAGDLADVEVLGGRPNEIRHVGRVRRLGGRGVRDRHDVRLDAAHDVQLRPLDLLLGAAGSLAPLVVKPAVVCGAGEAAAVLSEINLQVAQRQGGALNQLPQDRRHVGAARST